MSTDSHGHDDHGHGHDAHGHDAHGGHDAPGGHAAPAPVAAPEPEPEVANPETRDVEVRVLQAAFHLSTRSAFAYFAEPGSILAFTPEDKRRRALFEAAQLADGKLADRIAELVRERGVEPMAHAFHDDFTRLNYLTFSSAATFVRADVATQKETADRLLALLPAATTPSVREVVTALRDARAAALAAWSDEVKKVEAEVAAKAAARKAAAAKPPAKAH